MAYTLAAGALFNKILFFMVFNDFGLYGWYANSWPIFLIKITLL
ncbi:hypothetical protein LTSESEN_4791 [Salmonella enterica subsp. enterica serovar Senftenberg str. A4-543]|uniref:Uncharacterized protein n=1 Tax=Salmonella enterica subsp. enterica serovar Senftenberg str. A4-543 TaxID=913082 RepID=G5R596_SALSE|nr:hypothetical protein LTSESEN_4791 [Salmonella enterica subsp. enterica serovar Senftenberg str. A4-543]